MPTSTFLSAAALLSAGASAIAFPPLSNATSTANVQTTYPNYCSSVPFSDFASIVSAAPSGAAACASFLEQTTTATITNTVYTATESIQPTNFATITAVPATTSVLASTNDITEFDIQSLTTTIFTTNVVTSTTTTFSIGTANNVLYTSQTSLGPAPTCAGNQKRKRGALELKKRKQCVPKSSSTTTSSSSTLTPTPTSTTLDLSSIFALPTSQISTVCSCVTTASTTTITSVVTESLLSTTVLPAITITATQTPDPLTSLETATDYFTVSTSTEVTETSTIQSTVTATATIIGELILYSADCFNYDQIGNSITGNAYYSPADCLSNGAIEGCLAHCADIANCQYVDYTLYPGEGPYSHANCKGYSDQFSAGNLNCDPEQGLDNYYYLAYTATKVVTPPS